MSQQERSILIGISAMILVVVSLFFGYQAVTAPASIEAGADQLLGTSSATAGTIGIAMERGETTRLEKINDAKPKTHAEPESESGPVSEIVVKSQPVARGRRARDFG